MNKSFNLNHSLVSLIGRCKSMGHLMQIHAQMFTSGLSEDHSLVAKILSFSALSGFGDISYSYKVFLQLPCRNTVQYNTLIRGYSKSKNPNRAIAIYNQMLLSGVSPDNLTFPFLAKTCARLQSPCLGVAVHCHIAKSGLESDIYIQNSLVHMYSTCGDIVSARKAFDEIPQPSLVSWNAMIDSYAKCGDIASARGMFDLMPEHDVISWSALIGGYVESGDPHEALILFENMQAAGCKANEVTMVSTLCACADLGTLNQGRRMHQYIQDNGLQMSLALRTSLIDMYAKCGSIDNALQVFNGAQYEETDVLIWNAMIGGLATHGYSRESLDLFEEMQSLGVMPDEITYLALLSACAHAGQVDDAWRIFQSLDANDMVPKIEHYACMVDVLSRFGQLDEAYQLINTMPTKPTASMLGALLNGCRIHNRAELGETIGKRLIEIEPGHDGRYIGLSNVYELASRWDEARSMREVMEKRGVKKARGFSSVEVGRTQHKFIAHDKKHCQSIEVYGMLNLIAKEMRHMDESLRKEYDLFDIWDFE